MNNPPHAISPRLVTLLEIAAVVFFLEAFSLLLLALTWTVYGVLQPH